MIAAIFMWGPLISGPNIELLIVGDPLGVLDGAGKFRSKDLTINELCFSGARAHFLDGTASPPLELHAHVRPGGPPGHAHEESRRSR